MYIAFECSATRSQISTFTHGFSGQPYQNEQNGRREQCIIAPSANVARCYEVQSMATVSLPQDASPSPASLALRALPSESKHSEKDKDTDVDSALTVSFVRALHEDRYSYHTFLCIRCNGVLM